MKVVYKIDILKSWENNQSIPFTGNEELSISRDPVDGRSNVILAFNGHQITVDADELFEAIEGCTASY